jgi:soluble lytic murein transglycosylase-like protein
MKIPVVLQPYAPQIANAYEDHSSTSDAALFADFLQAEVTAGQRVITAQQIAAELNGSPRWEFLQPVSGNDTYTTDGKDGQSSLPVSTILEKIERVARSYGVDEDLVREVVRAESNFNPSATSHAGAKGLMQLMDATAKAMRVRNVYNPDENLAGGTKYLKELIERFDGNVGVALAAYNAGPTRVSRLGITNDEQLMEKYHLLPEETQRYVEKIMSRL